MTDAQTTDKTTDEELNEIADKFDIPRANNEGDSDFGERIIAALDDMLLELWSVQDRVRELLDEC